MLTEPARGPLNIEQLVSQAVWEFREETKFKVAAGVDRLLIETGLKERVYLEEKYIQQKFTTGELIAAIKELLSRARLMAQEKGRDIIDVTTAQEAMKLYCPFWPWC